MFCKYCGSEIVDDAVFCQKCGKKLIESEKQTLTSVQSDSIPEVLAEPETLFHDHDLEDMPQDKPASGKPSWFGKDETVRNSNVSRTRKAEWSHNAVFILAILVVVVGIPFIVFRLNRENIYKNKHYPVYEGKMKTYDYWINAYNANKTVQNAQASETAGLDMLESYMDYYEGMNKVRGKGDYSDMNMAMDSAIIQVEHNHDIIYPLGASDYDYRMAQIKNRWKYIKR